MNSKLIIPEGSKIRFELRGVGNSNDIIKTAEVYENMEIWGNTILIIDDGLYCTDSINPVEKINKNEFKIIIWFQDALIVKDDCLYKSLDNVN